MKNYISENLLYLVNKLKCSQDDFGKMFDLNRGNINQYVKEKTQPKIETIQKICSHFDITIDDFINRKLEEVDKNVLAEPQSSYKKEEENEIIQLLKSSINDKNKLIESLERELAAHNEAVKRKPA